MSTIKIDDVEYVPSDENIEVSEQLNNDIVRHEQPSTSVQIHTQSIENHSRHSPIISSFNENSEIMPVAVVYDSQYNQENVSVNIDDVYEYQIWSIFNILFCCLIIGSFALHMSCATRKKKRRGNVLLAKTYSKLSALLNVVATLSGILIFTIVALRFLGYISI